ncbi:reverse transcriptase [Gossypium australe]|uniref:Reverse transcriptase n=1 Tax=Gossypium australe TaxID=47621 RepID=A0A5B6WZ31_9ROSI|nr:reverse transcriptase [Gossypium australe]
MEGGMLDSGINKKLLVLISKTIGVESLNQFCPINLCTILYKIITKNMVNRRNISNNIINAQEAVRTMNTTKSFMERNNHGTFLSNKGEKGDPLSLYLFVLGMKRLEHLIDRAVDNND